MRGPGSENGGLCRDVRSRLVSRIVFGTNQVSRMVSFEMQFRLWPREGGRLPFFRLHHDVVVEKRRSKIDRFDANVRVRQKGDMLVCGKEAEPSGTV